MKKIITLTFSPCIDKSTTVQTLIPETKLKCLSPKLEPGGGGINVTRAIKKLGGEAMAIFPSGGYTGEFFNHLLEKENVHFLPIKTVHETRENFIVLEESTNNQFRFGMPGTELLEDEWQKCLKAVEGIEDVDFIIASGSLPPGVPLDIYAQLAKIAKKNNAKLIIDASGEALKQALEEGIYLLKPNLTELSSLAGKPNMTVDEVKIFAKDIISKGKCAVLVISMGADGAMLVTKDSITTIKPPVVERKSTVGAGDSMVAGITFYLAGGKSLLDSVKFGVACGTAATMNSGTELCKKEDADRLLGLLEVVQL